jgi:hypothetical protein
MTEAYEELLKRPEQRDELPERVVCAAVHYQDGNKYEHQPRNIESGVVICGWRHHNCLATVFALKPSLKMESATIQGFITTKGRFVDRKEARIVAFKAGQVKDWTSNHRDILELFSEDLY